ncbi:hypothetical protein ACFSTA_20480 [Ornithinibacillus salinisoli]|uniref:Uncharacterized protein n=1 Tax=Ornithinibacillus salinisoli TaxID=1848459 RepID=A0ABW4W4K1_9BACI
MTTLVTFSTVSEAASVSPYSQTIRGSDQKASWTFSWNQGGANAVRFNPGDGAGSRLWDSRNSKGYSQVYYTYSTNERLTSYRPSFSAVKLSDGTAETASAYVEHRLP